jgi:hypothetical protein
MERTIQEKEDWLNEHGEPDFAFLTSLVREGGPAAQEKLNSIADDLNVEHNPDISNEDLIERIGSITSRNEDDGKNTTT